MKKMSVTLLSAAVLSALSLSANACTGLIVGKGASVDGSIMIARNEDFGINNWNKYLAYRPAQENEAGDWTLGNGLTVPMPAKFYGYSAIPDWDANTVDGDGKFYEERGINEYNVAISATTSAEVNDKAQTADPLVEKGIIEAIIPTLILPQVKTAKEGVELLGNTSNSMVPVKATACISLMLTRHGWLRLVQGTTGLQSKYRMTATR